MAVLQGSFLSSELGRLSHFTVILPHDTVTNPPENGYPVLYILPGRTDDCNTWLYRTNIERYAYFKGLAVVMPSGDGSFYANMASGGRYFTMVTKELPEVVRNMFRVGFSRQHTYICGAAMGGYGALRCALTFPEQYAGCIALSPITDLEDFVNKEISAGKTECWRGILGERMLVPREMELNNLVSESHTYSQIQPLIYLACGKRDELYPTVVRLRDMLDRNKMDFIFEQADAGHEWGFWDIAVQRGLDAILPDGAR